MTAGLLSIAAPEMSLALAAQAEVAQSFGLPSWGLAGSTDAKVLDAQAGVFYPGPGVGRSESDP